MIELLSVIQCYLDNFLYYTRFSLKTITLSAYIIHHDYLMINFKVPSQAVGLNSRTPKWGINVTGISS